MLQSLFSRFSPPVRPTGPWIPSPRSTSTLVLLACIAVLGWRWVESSPRTIDLPWRQQMVQATEHSRHAAAHLSGLLRQRGHVADPLNDPQGRLLIGPRRSPLTSLAGSLDAKLLSTNPHFAAFLVDALRRLDVEPGATVAVAVSGSFPALNISTFSALRVLGAKPVVISSVASSSWGAGDPEMTWLDMERLLVDGGWLSVRSTAASIGAGDDIGRGLDAEGRRLAMLAMERNGVAPLLPSLPTGGPNDPSLRASIERRLHIYAQHGPIAAFVNVGGGAASLGHLSPDVAWPGVVETAPPREVGELQGVAVHLAREGVPVVHLRGLRRLTSHLELPDGATPAGLGHLYRPRRMNRFLAAAVLGFLVTLIGCLTWLDRRRHRLGALPVAPVVKGCGKGAGDDKDRSATLTGVDEPTGAVAILASPARPRSSGWASLLAVLWLVGIGLAAPQSQARGASGTATGESPTEPPVRWDLRLDIDPSYDSNILRYSDKFIDRFDQGSEPDRFRVESLDDTITRVSLRLRRRGSGFGGHPMTVWWRLDHAAYARNGIKDRSRFELAWRQSLVRDWRLALTARWTPDAYIRHQRDADLRGSTVVGAQRYRPFGFERLALEGRVEKRWSNVWSGWLEAEGASYRYSEDFREFDSEDLRLGLRLNQRLNRRWRMTYRYRYTTSSAAGVDEAGELRATSDDSDPSYDQHALYLAGRVRWPGQGRGTRTFRLAVEVFERRFTSPRSATQNPLYAGRRDDRLRFDASYQWPLRRDLEMAVYVQWSQRTATSDLSPVDLGREKDYDVWVGGLRLTYGRRLGR